MKKLITFIFASILFASAYFFGPKLMLFYQYSDLINALESIKQNQYTENYQCLEFSQDLVKNLQSKGIDSQVQIVDNGNPDNFHAVVSLQIEPQTGRMVNYKTVDNCQLQNGSLVCENGFLKNRNLYIAQKQ